MKIRVQAICRMMDLCSFKVRRYFIFTKSNRVHSNCWVMVKCFVHTNHGRNHHGCFVPQHDKQWVFCSALLLKFNFIKAVCHSDAGGIHLRFNHCRFFNIMFASMGGEDLPTVRQAQPTAGCHGWWDTKPATIWNAPKRRAFLFMLRWVMVKSMQGKYAGVGLVMRAIAGL